MPAPRNQVEPLPAVRDALEEIYQEHLPAILARVVRKRRKELKAAILEAAERARAEWEQEEAERKKKQGESFRPTQPPAPLPEDAELIDDDLLIGVLAAELDRGYLKDIVGRYYVLRSIMRAARRLKRPVASRVQQWGAIAIGSTRQNFDRHMYLRPSNTTSTLIKGQGRVPDLSGLTREQLEAQIEAELDAEEQAKQAS